MFQIGDVFIRAHDQAIGTVVEVGYKMLVIAWKGTAGLTGGKKSYVVDSVEELLKTRKILRTTALEVENARLIENFLKEED